MRCLWLTPLLLAGLGCSDGEMRSGSVPEPADFLPMVADSTDQTSEQPRLVVRCEQGRLDAFLIVGTPEEVESGRLDDRAVPVQLDSAPSC